MSNRKSRLDTFNIVVLIIAVLQQASAFYGQYLFWVEEGTAAEYINEFVMSIPFHAALYLGVPLLIRHFVNKGPVKRKEGIGISIALLIVLYLIHVMIIAVAPEYFGLDLAITFTLIGHVFLTIPQKTKTAEKMPDSKDADVLSEEIPGKVDVDFSDNDVCVNNEAITLQEELCIQEKNYCNKCGNNVSSNMSFCPYCGSKMDSANNFKRLSENKTLETNKKPKKRLAIICIVVVAIVAVVGLVMYCNYDNWKLQKIETELTTTTAIKTGDIEVLENLRAEYISYGGDVATFDRLIQEDIENEFINAIDAKDSDKYKAYNEYLSKIGYTPDLISELICCTNLADTLQSAVRANNEDLAVDCLSILIDAGITKEYYEILFNDALK